jgi:hypothetical protein
MAVEEVPALPLPLNTINSIKEFIMSDALSHFFSEISILNKTFDRSYSFLTSEGMEISSSPSLIEADESLLNGLNKGLQVLFSTLDSRN